MHERDLQCREQPQEVEIVDPPFIRQPSGHIGHRRQRGARRGSATALTDPKSLTLPVANPQSAGHPPHRRGRRSLTLHCLDYSQPDGWMCLRTSADGRAASAFPPVPRCRVSSRQSYAPWRAAAGSGDRCSRPRIRSDFSAQGVRNERLLRRALQSARSRVCAPRSQARNGVDFALQREAAPRS